MATITPRLPHQNKTGEKAKTLKSPQQKEKNITNFTLAKISVYLAIA
jgi:hypothetical protein